MCVTVLVERTSTASWILQHWTPLLPHCPPHATSKKGVWSTTAVFHPRRMSKSRSLAGKWVSDTQQSCQPSSAWYEAKTFGRLPCGCCCLFLIFFRLAAWWKEDWSGSHSRAALFKRLLLSLLSLPKATMASSHFSGWVSHHAYQDFLVCMPGLSYTL